jgi:glycosyltransferase involved in cell wall biosynthesis
VTPTLTPTLTFAIPTWNRPEHLERAVQSIAKQVMPEDEGRVSIVIINDASGLDTTEMIDSLNDRWPFVTSITREEHIGYADVFRDMFRASPSSDWVWTFGDDDLLRPGAMTFMLERLKATPPELVFMHIAELKRASGTNNVYSASSLFDLCNTFGWIEMTGFITGNITRGARLAKAADTAHWKTYAKSAFVQSCALLEELVDEPCAFLDLPLITSQEVEQTEDTMQRWSEQKISERYLYVVDALEIMYEEGVLKKKVQSKFFRYLVYHLWDRYITHFISDYINHKALWTDQAWGRIIRFSQFLADEEEAQKIASEAEAVRGMMQLGLYMSKNLDGLHEEIISIFKRRNEALYPYTFVPAKLAEPEQVAT